ncbi:uncharacterized protein LOC133104267 [Eubalaena glacialis]|uniref:uncharacterized protein LOC133104267 n=1 Tax=Eubalaena glacialis TaxID=27606 RepID=UPI002A5AE958|nr:uncharacterized protein LOC133104267 [Eubalaena glacialis]
MCLWPPLLLDAPPSAPPPASVRDSPLCPSYFSRRTDKWVPQAPQRPRAGSQAGCKCVQAEFGGHLGTRWPQSRCWAGPGAQGGWRATCTCVDAAPPERSRLCGPLRSSQACRASSPPPAPLAPRPSSRPDSLGTALEAGTSLCLAPGPGARAAREPGPGGHSPPYPPGRRREHRLGVWVSPWWLSPSQRTPRWGAGIPPPGSESPVRTGVLGKRLPGELAESQGPAFLLGSRRSSRSRPVHPSFAPTLLPPRTASLSPHSCFQDACRARALGAGRRDLSPNLPAPKTQGPSTGGAAGPWSLILPSLVPGPHASERCRGGGHLQGSPCPPPLRPSAPLPCAARSRTVPPGSHPRPQTAPADSAMVHMVYVCAVQQGGYWAQAPLAPLLAPSLALTSHCPCGQALPSLPRGAVTPPLAAVLSPRAYPTPPAHLASLDALDPRPTGAAASPSKCASLLRHHAPQTKHRRVVSSPLSPHPKPSPAAIVSTPPPNRDLHLSARPPWPPWAKPSPSLVGQSPSLPPWGIHDPLPRTARGTWRAFTGSRCPAHSPDDNHPFLPRGAKPRIATGTCKVLPHRPPLPVLTPPACTHPLPCSHRAPAPLFPPGELFLLLSDQKRPLPLPQIPEPAASPSGLVDGAPSTSHFQSHHFLTFTAVLQATSVTERTYDGDSMCEAGTEFVLSHQLQSPGRR